MINKKSLWFLTLFSLILVLSIYYITMPSELLLTTNKNNITIGEKEDKEVNIDVEESNLLVALRVEADEEMSKEIEDLKLILTNSESSVDDKNKAYEKIKKLNDNRGEEEKLESQIKENYKLDSFVKINNNQIHVTVNSSEHSESPRSCRPSTPHTVPPIPASHPEIPRRPAAASADAYQWKYPLCNSSACTGCPRCTSGRTSTAHSPGRPRPSAD